LVCGLCFAHCTVETASEIRSCSAAAKFWVAIPSGSPKPRSFPSIRRFITSPDRLVVTLTVDDEGLMIALVVPNQTGSTDTIARAIRADEPVEMW